MVWHTVIGGKLHPEFGINWSGGPPVTPEDIEKQVEHSRALGLPSVIAKQGTIPDIGRKLAVVGGGPSIEEHEDELRNWDGDLWSVNGAYHWLRTRNMPSTFVACDPHIIVADWALNVKKALVTTRCHPKVFEVLRDNEAEVRTFDLEGDNRVVTGSSTATASINLAVLDGYKDITFFGCESSYPPGQSHAYMHEPREHELIVQCGDGEYHTAPDYLIQAVELAAVIRASDNGLHERSGGLLRAMVENPVYRITWVSEALWGTLKNPQVFQEAAE